MNSIQLDRAALANLVNHRAVQADLDRRTAAAVQAGRAACPVDTGALRETIHAERKGASRTVSMGGPGFGYARYVEYGTRPHIILPRRKQALAWPDAAHPVPGVYHPGTRAHHVITGAATDAAKRSR